MITTICAGNSITLQHQEDQLMHEQFWLQTGVLAVLQTITQEYYVTGAIQCLSANRQ